MKAILAVSRALAAAAALCVVVHASEFSTWVGDTSDYHIVRIATDALGNTYVGGSRVGAGLSEAVAMKLDPTGKLVLFTVLNGKGNDTVNDMAVDSSGNIYLAGGTNSPAFPLQNAYQSTPGPGFIAKISADGLRIVYATYFPEVITAMAVDSAGSVYVTGNTMKTSFPVTTGLPSGPVSAGVGGVFAAFLTKISPDGSRIMFSALFGGYGKNCGAGSSCFLSSRTAIGASVAVDRAGNAYVAGNTDITDLPATGDALLKSGPGAWVAKVNAAGTALVYLTYLSNGNFVLTPFSFPETRATALAADADGNAYVVGTTVDPSFPATAGAYQTKAPNGGATPDSPTDAFVAKLNPNGTALVWATYLGGPGSDAANSVAVDASGTVWLAGTTASGNFPNIQGWSQGGDFLVALNATGSALSYAARYPDGSVSQSATVDSSGALHAAGSTGLVSSILPGATPSPHIVGVANAAYGRLSGHVVPVEILSVYGPHIGPVSPVTAAPDDSGRYPATLAGIQLLIDGTAARILFASDSQINAVAPYCYPCRTAQLVSNGVPGPQFPITGITADPEIFQNADGSAVAVNQDGSLNSPSQPADAGSVVSIWATGVPLDVPWLYGQVATQAVNLNCCELRLHHTASTYPPSGFLENSVGNVLYAGSSPGVVSAVAQINFQVPDGLLPDESKIGLSVAASGASSAGVATIYVRPPQQPAASAKQRD